jgi:hypothetical protein
MVISIEKAYPATLIFCLRQYLHQTCSLVIKLRTVLVSSSCCVHGETNNLQTILKTMKFNRLKVNSIITSVCTIPSAYFFVVFLPFNCGNGSNNFPRNNGKRLPCTWGLILQNGTRHSQHHESLELHMRLFIRL